MRSVAVFACVIAIVSVFAGMGTAIPLSAVARAASDTSLDNWLAVVHVHDDVHVTGPDIVLGDIARVETADEQLRIRLQQLVLGRAALPGQRRELHVATMQTRMRQQRLPVQRIHIETGTPEFPVHTRSNTVSGPALAQTALAAVESYAASTSRAAAADSRWLIECAAPDQVTVADGDLGLQLQRVSGTAPGALVVTLDVVVAGAVQRTVTVRCDAVLETDVLVLNTSVKRHDVLRAEAFAVERRTFTSLPRERLAPVGTADESDRWRLTRPLQPGTVLTVDMVESLPVVRRGGNVSIVAALDRIEVSVPGVALSDGRPGDVIRVENVLSGQVVQVFVIDSERVEALLH